MVGGLIKDKAVSAGYHHLGKEASYFFTTGKYLDFLDSVLAREEHSSEEASYICDILDGRVSHEPFGYRIVVIELLSAVFGEISL